mgnify:CR=1 FL=1|jgi:hypothetical protein
MSKRVGKKGAECTGSVYTRIQAARELQPNASANRGCPSALQEIAGDCRYDEEDRGFR